MKLLAPASSMAAGSLAGEHNAARVVYWRRSWGGAGYTGSNAGSDVNDGSVFPAPGDFGPPWPGPLPSTGVQALQFQGPFNALSTTNAADYALTSDGSEWINNALGLFAPAAPACPWDCDSAESNDGTVGIVDFLALLSQWGGPGSCDFDGGGVGITDFLELLANWGPCP